MPRTKLPSTPAALPIIRTQWFSTLTDPPVMRGQYEYRHKDTPIITMGYFINGRWYLMGLNIATLPGLIDPTESYVWRGIAE